MKRLRVSSELTYAFAILILSFSVAMMSAADFGLSMIVAPAYILSQKIGLLSFGQCEYVIQGLVFILFCILMKKVRPVYLFSFVTCLIYGAVLDFWRAVIPAFNPRITPPGTAAPPVRALFFAAGMVLTALAVALFFKTYIYPQVYDFFVKCVSARYKIDRTLFKRCFDLCCLALSAAMTLAFFRGFVGIGWGTVIMTAFNGVIIGFFDKKLDRLFEFVPTFPKAAVMFEEG